MNEIFSAEIIEIIPMNFDNFVLTTVHLSFVISRYAVCLCHHAILRL